MAERMTFGEAFLMIAFRNLGKEEGEKNFDRYVELANKSSIPVAYYDACAVVLRRNKSENDADKAYQEIARYLYEADFKNPRLASYAVLYGEAIALTNAWLIINGKLTEAIELVREVEQKRNETRALIKESSLRNRGFLQSNLEQLESQVERASRFCTKADKIADHFRNLAVVKCGHVSIIEQFPEKRTLKTEIKERLTGQFVTSEDLENVRQDVEKYFSNPQKQIRMIHIANSDRLDYLEEFQA